MAESTTTKERGLLEFQLLQIMAQDYHETDLKSLYKIPVYITNDLRNAIDHVIESTHDDMFIEKYGEFATNRAYAVREYIITSKFSKERTTLPPAPVPFVYFYGKCTLNAPVYYDDYVRHIYISDPKIILNIDFDEVIGRIDDMGIVGDTKKVVYIRTPTTIALTDSVKAITGVNFLVQRCGIFS